MMQNDYISSGASDRKKTIGKSDPTRVRVLKRSGDLAMRSCDSTATGGVGMLYKDIPFYK